MKVKNIPFEMDSDDVAMLAMMSLRGSGKLNDKNVDCFIQGYNACLDALCNPAKILPLLVYHKRQYAAVEQKIKDYIGYTDLRRGFDEEERTKIEFADKVCKALEPLIEILNSIEEDERS